jgi:acyl carrier protein
MNWLKNLIGTQAAPSKQDVSECVEAPAGAGPEMCPEDAVQILADLKMFLSERMDASSKVDASDIPDSAHVLDGGYIDSVTAADYLVFIQSRYGVRLAETDLAGGLGRLATLAGHLAGRAA